MIYILFDDRTHNLSPEIEYGGGSTVQFKRGLFLFNEDEEKDVYFSKYDGTITIESHQFPVHKKHTFSNPVRAEIVFLNLKLKEMKECAFNFFLPISYNKYIERYNELKEEYPEYVI